MEEREKHRPGTDRKHPEDPEKRRKSRELDRELDDSFPASDPPSITQPVPDKDEKD